MTKHLYLFPGKIAVSDTEKPTYTNKGTFEKLNFFYDGDLRKDLEKWHSSLTWYQIASKEDYAKLIRLAKKSHFTQFNNYNLSLEQGIKINSENVEVKIVPNGIEVPNKHGKDIYYHSLAYFKESKPEETQETNEDFKFQQNELWKEANRLYNLKNHTQDGRDIQMKHFIITRK